MLDPFMADFVRFDLRSTLSKVRKSNDMRRISQLALRMLDSSHRISGWPPKITHDRSCLFLALLPFWSEPDCPNGGTKKRSPQAALKNCSVSEAYISMYFISMSVS